MQDGYFLILLVILFAGLITGLIFLHLAKDESSKRRRGRVLAVAGLSILVASFAWELVRR